MRRSLICPQCNGDYGTKDPARPHGAHLPLLLNCGHSFCEGCLTKISKQQKTAVICPKCKFAHKLEDGHEGTVRGISTDNHILGVLAARRKLSHERKPRSMTFTPVVSPIPKTHSKEVVCPECCERECTVKCKECRHATCGQCFSKIHSASKLLKKHQAVNLGHNESMAIVPTNCSEHNRPVEYFCEQCDEMICGHCVVLGAHKHHKGVIAIEEKNKKALLEIRPALDDAWVVLQRMTNSHKTLRDLPADSDQGIYKLADEIKTHFHSLHSALQIREEALLSEVRKMKSNIGMDELKTKLQNDVEQLREIVLNGNAFSEDQPISVNAQVILDKLKSAMKIPAVLIKLTSTPEDTYRFTTEDAIFKEVAKHGKIVGHASAEYKLMSVEQAPKQLLETDSENFTPLPSSGLLPLSILLKDDADSITDTLKTRSTTGSQNTAPGPDIDLSDGASVASGGSAGTSGSTKGKKKRQTFMTSFNRGDKVTVTHIETPCHFYVRKISEENRYRTVCLNIMNYMKCGTRSRKSVVKAQPGSLVLAPLYHNSHHRGKVLRISPTDYVPSDEINHRAEVLFIDIGVISSVNFHELRDMPMNCQRIPPLATLCGLYDIDPAGPSGQWNPDAKAEFENISKKEPLLIKVYQPDKEKLLVDLQKTPDADMEEESNTSIRDTLVFLELACFTSEHTSNVDSGHTAKPVRQYIRTSVPSVGDKLSVVTPTLESPDRFFIQKADAEASYLVTLISNLRAYYSNPNIGDLYTIHCPQLDMLCVAPYSQDGDWYRAQVTRLPGRRKVEVKFVDFGDIEEKPYWQLRTIHPKFCILPALALQCKLADVEPVNEEGWTQPAKEFMRLLAFRQCHIVVKDVFKKTDDDYILSVVLYDSEGEEQVNVNALLVENNLAISTGPGSDPNAPPAAFSPRRSNHATEGAAEFTPPKSVIASPKDMEAEEERQNQIGTDFTSPLANAGRNAVSIGAGMERHRPGDWECRITNIVSPGELYAQANDMDDRDRMMHDLRDYCNSHPYEDHSWNSGEIYAAQWIDDVWYRVYIEHVVLNSKAQVVLVDFNHTKEVPLSRLRKLDHTFRDQAPFEFKCHLDRIIPAGDINAKRWSSTATESIQEFLSKHDIVFITKTGDVKKGSLPVDIVTEYLQRGDALSGDTYVYTSLCDILLEGGLGLPSQRTKPPRPASYGLPPPFDLTESITPSLPQFLPPKLPTTQMFRGVATYVSMAGEIYVQEIRDDKCGESRIGYILKETTLEAIIQNEHLMKLDLYRAKLPGDGDCLYRAISQGIFHNQSHHKSVREAVAGAVETNWDVYCSNLPGQFRSQYAQSIRQGAHGGEVELQIICQLYDVQAHVYLNGLTSNVKKLCYGEGGEKKVNFVYTADGEIDAGHYDVVVESAEDVKKVEDEAYSDWRMEQVELFNQDPKKHGADDNIVLGQLIKSLNDKYHGSKPNPLATYQVGRAVIAQYSRDDNFYRGTITCENSDGTFRVFFVDFGNEENVPRDRLRDDVISLNVPAVCFPCVPVDVKPNTHDGEWTIPKLDLYHNVAVDKKFTIQIKEPQQANTSLLVDMEFDGHIKLVDILKEKGVALHVDDPLPPAPVQKITYKSVSEVTEAAGSMEEYLFPKVGTPHPDRQALRGTPYNTIQGVNDDNVMICTVTSLDGHNHVYIQRCKQLQADEASLLLVNKQLEDLEIISLQMNTDAATYGMVPPADISMGKACCAQFSQDSCWYRAEIIAVEMIETTTFATVIYVDYGNWERVPINRLRTLPTPYLALPAQALRVRLLDVNPRPDQIDDMIEALLSSVLQPISLVAVFKNSLSATSDLTVALYPEANFLLGDETLLYQDILDAFAVAELAVQGHSRTPTPSIAQHAVKVPVCQAIADSAKLSQVQGAGEAEIILSEDVVDVAAGIAESLEAVDLSSGCDSTVRHTAEAKAIIEGMYAGVRENLENL